ncbi:MAG: glycosyltransferase family 4 protein [Opitutales bacterium]
MRAVQGEAVAMASSVTIVTHEFFPKRGGIAVYVEETARAAVKVGYGVEAWAPQTDGLSERGFPFPVHALGNKGSLGAGCRRTTRRKLLARRSDFLDTLLWLPEPGPIMALAEQAAWKSFSDIPIVLTLHGSEILRLHRWPHWRGRFARLLERADRIGVVSEPIEALLLERFGKSLVGKTMRVPGALRHDFESPVETFVPPPEPTGERIVFLTVARVHPRKGQLAMLEGLGALPEPLKKRVLYRIAGPSTDEKYLRVLEREATLLGVAFEYAGAVADTDLPKIYAQARVFAMTSQRLRQSIEGFGLVYLEAAARGLPVLAHRTGGVTEAVADGVSGLLVEPGDRAALTQACRRLIEDAELRARLSAGGRQHLERFSWSTNVERLFATCLAKSGD